MQDAPHIGTYVATLFRLVQIFGTSVMLFVVVAKSSTGKKNHAGNRENRMSTSVRIRTNIRNVSEDESPKMEMSE